MGFREELEKGRAGESLISYWLRAKGYDVLPAYEKILDTGKGPQLFTPSCAYIAPDLLAFNGQKVMWVEAKHKTAFTWHRNTGEFVTGIDLRHYHDYCAIDKRGPWPVSLVFLHDGGVAKDSPPSPSGLYGNYLRYLREHEHHRSDKWGKSGMVYWAINSLKKLAELDEIKKPEINAPAQIVSYRF